MIKILIDGREASLVVDNGRRTKVLDPNDFTMEVIWEFEPEHEEFYGKGGQVAHRFTSEGVIVEARNDEKVFPITHGLWDQLAADANMKP